MSTTHTSPFETYTSFEDLTDEQVNDLNDEQVDWLIKRAMAEAGIPILPMPVEPEYLPVAGPDISVYAVVGEHFNDRDAAERIQQVINAHSSERVRLGYGRDYGIKFVEANDSRVDVTTVMAYSPQAYAEHRTVLDQNADRKRAYDTERSQYQEAERKAEHIRNAITNRIEDVRAQVAHTDMLATRFLEYRSIANGDDLMAMQFLQKAFDLSDEDIASVRAHELVVGGAS